MIGSDQEQVRLHITPLNEEIYSRIIPPSLAHKVANLSLHALQTFPDRGFGFVDMPREDAEKLKKKLNGSILKGTKMRIEDARPVTKRKSDAAEEKEEDVIARKKPKLDRKTKAGKTQGVLAGYQLEDGRHVKRAWTDDTTARTKEKRSKAPKDKSQNDADRKLLFKTAIPPNVVVTKDKTLKKEKKSKEEAKRRKGDNTTVVKEFSRQRKSFAIGQDRTKDVKPAVEYVDGKGWVDDEGEVVEAAPRSTRGSVQRSQTAATYEESAIDQSQPAAQTQAEDASSQAASEDAQFSEEESSADEFQDSAESQAEVSKSHDVHPLEALYKRRSEADKGDAKLSLAPIDTSFSFFGAGTAEEETGPEEAVSETYPQTPHTKQEFEWRAQRSAAPTPDTAAIDGRFGYPFGADDDDEDEEEDEIEADSPTRQHIADTETNGPANPPTGAQEESAFRKYFYEHRGDNDRAWKKKRREAKKQQRQRENRRLSRRVV